jgi:uncharacterized membrane protein
VAPVSRPDWLVGGLAVAGLLVSGYLTWLKLTGAGAALCVAGSGCDIVQASRYAVFLGVPTAAWGAAVYVVIAALAVTGLGARNWLVAFLFAAGGVGFSLYLTGLSVFELGATCVWCLASATILIAIVAALLRRRPPPHGRKSPFRTPRLATYGLLVAIGTVVAGAFVYAAPFSAPAGYQSALARHLAKTNSVMYGAFW